MNINKFDNLNNNEFTKLIKEMTNIEAFSRPDIENILIDKINYPSLYKRYKLLEKNLFCLSYDLNKIPNLKYQKYDFSSKSINLKDLFIKRSDSMKMDNFG